MKLLFSYIDIRQKWPNAIALSGLSSGETEWLCLHPLHSLKTVFPRWIYWREYGIHFCIHSFSARFRPQQRVLYPICQQSGCCLQAYLYTGWWTESHTQGLGMVLGLTVWISDMYFSIMSILFVITLILTILMRIPFRAIDSSYLDNICCLSEICYLLLCIW